MTTTKRKQPRTYNGFPIPLQADTDLGRAMLIAEDEEGHTQPVAIACSINEGRDIAQSDLAGRMGRLMRDEDPGICPYEYKLWARGADGGYRLAATILATDI